METLKSIWSFISFIDDILSPAVDVFKSEDFNSIFNSTVNDNTIKDSIETTGNEK